MRSRENLGQVEGYHAYVPPRTTEFSLISTKPRIEHAIPESIGNGPSNEDYASDLQEVKLDSSVELANHQVPQSSRPV